MSYGIAYMQSNKRMAWCVDVGVFLSQSFSSNTPVDTMACASIFTTGTATLFPISFIHRERAVGRMKSGGKPCMRHASDLVICLYLCL